VEVVRASIVATPLIRLEIAQTRALQHVITAADRDTLVENVLYRQRKSLATGARALGIFRVIAPKAAVAVEDTVDRVGILPMVAAAAAVRNATSVGRLVILPAIAAKVEEGLGLHTAVLTVEAVEAAVSRLATLAADMATWLETVRKVKNATTVVKSAMSRVTALPKLAENVSVTNASNLVTSKRLVPAKVAGEISKLGRLFWIMHS